MASKSHRALYEAPNPSQGVRRWRKAIHAAVAIQRLKSRERDNFSREAYKAPDSICHVSPFFNKEDHLEKLQKTFADICRSLLTLKEVPYNPYPGVVRRLMKKSERFHFNQLKEGDIVSKLNPPVKATVVPHLSQSSSIPPVFGLESILRLIDPLALDKYQPVIDTLTPKSSDLAAYKGHSIQVMTALVGPAVFTGTFLKSAKFVHLRQEYLVTGLDARKAIQLFGESVLQEVIRVGHMKTHSIKGLTVPTVNIKPVPAPHGRHGRREISAESLWTDVLWEMDRIHLEKDDFFSALCEAVLGNQMVTMECIFQLDKNGFDCVHGQIQCVLNFVEVGDGKKEEALTSFTEFPMATLHEGVFLKKSHGEAYMGMFLPLLLGQKTNGGVVVDKPSSLTVKKEAKPSNRKTVGNASYLTEGPVLKKFVKGSDGRHTRVELDGFRFEELKTEGPFSSQITRAIKSQWQNKLLHLDTNLELLDSLYYILLLIALNREEESLPLIVEIGRIFASDVGCLRDLIEQSQILSSIIGTVSETGDWTLIKKHLHLLKHKLDTLFGDKLREYSSDEVTVCHVLSARINTLMNKDHMGQRSDNEMRQLASMLKSMGQFLQTMLITKTENILSLCPDIQKLLADLQKLKAKPELKAESKGKARRPSKQHTHQVHALGNTTHTHGFEDEHINKHDKWVIRVSECSKHDPSPEAINTEAVLIKYMLDIHLDEVWSDFLIELFSQSDIPPNIYPRLATHMRHASLKVDLWFEEVEKLKEKILSNSARPNDDFTYIHYIPGCTAHGAEGIMSLLDPEGFAIVKDLTKDFIPKFYIQMKGLFRVAISTALTGQSVMYGKMSPYLPLIELDEHVYIKGPEGCTREAVQLCANIVLDELTRLFKKGEHPVSGVYFGKDEYRLSEDNIKQRPAQFVTEFTSASLKSQQIYLKVYVCKEWRYYPVIKRYKLHWVAEKRTQLLYAPDPSEFYRSVFFEKDRAVFYCQNDQSLDGDPDSPANIRRVNRAIEESIYKIVKEEHDFYNVHKLLFVQALLNKDSDSYVEAWRVFHSLSAQVEYVNSLNTTLQELVAFTLEWQTKEQDTDNRGADENNSVEENVMGPIKLSVLNEMTSEFLVKMSEVMKSQISMSPKNLCDTVMSKLTTVHTTDHTTGEIKIELNQRTIAILEEVRNMLVAIGNSISADLHHVLSLAKSKVTRILIGPSARQKRVLSAHLNQPNAFLQPPVAGKTKK